MGSGDRAWGEAIQPLDVQTGSSCAALLGIGRPLGLRTDTSRDWSDSLQIPGTQQPVALIVTGDTQSCHGKEQKTGRQAGILQHDVGHGCYHFLNMEENLIWGQRGGGLQQAHTASLLLPGLPCHWSPEALQVDAASTWG